MLRGWRGRGSGLLGKFSAQTRRQAAVALVVLHYLIVLVAGAWYNWNVSAQRAAALAEAVRYEAELARAAAVRLELNQAEAEGEALQARREALYRHLPGPEALPIVVGQLEALAEAVGGRLTDVQYVPPEWNGRRGAAGLRITFEGTFRAVYDYIASVSASTPTLLWREVELAPAGDGGRRVVLYADVRLDVLADRPAGASAWDGGAVQVVRGGVRRDPFAALVTAADPLPALAVRGILYQDGRRLALLSVDGATHLVEPGQSVAGIAVVDVTADAVVVRSGQRTVELRLDD